MAWSANLVKKEVGDASVTFTIEFTDGIHSIQERITTAGDVDLSFLKKKLIARVNNLNKLTNIFTNISVGPIDLTPDPIVPPTQDEVDFSVWRTEFRKLEFLNKLVSNGVLAQNNADVAAKKSLVQTTWKPVFIGFL